MKGFVHEWCQKENGTEIYRNGVRVGTAVGMPGAKDTFAMVEDGVICWTRTLEKPAEEMTMRFAADYSPTYQLIPAVQYDGNKCYIQDYVDVRNSVADADAQEKKKMPTFFLGNKDPETGEPWRLIWHRSSVPGGSYSEGILTGQAAKTENGGEEIRAGVGMFLPVDQPGGAFSIYEENGQTMHELLWPEQDSRLIYFPDPEKRVRKMEPSNVFRAMLVFTEAKEERVSWYKLLEAAWKQYYQLKAPVRNYEQLWDLGVDYAKQLYTEEDDGFKGFSIGFTWEGKWVKRSVQKYEIGWCGQNASLANSLLAHAQKTGDQEAKEKAVAVLDAWIAAAKPHGLIPTHYDDNQYTNGFQKTVDACNLGTAALQFFEAGERAEALGISRPEYTEMAVRICEFAQRVMNEEGQIGKSWLESDLSPAVKTGTTGAFLSMALCEGAVRTGREDFREAALKSCRYYNQELLKNGYTTAGALDIFTIDKESSIPLLKSNLMMYRLTGEAEFLENAVRAGWYLSTWQWHYTRNYPKGSLLQEMQFDTFGGTAVSIHGGMDPFALNYIHEIADLAELTGNEQWKQRANGIWRHGQMCISDGDLVIDGKDPRPRGSQDESTELTLSTHWENEPSQWLVAWPTAFRLEALRRVLWEDGDRFGRIF